MFRPFVSGCIELDTEALVGATVTYRNTTVTTDANGCFAIERGQLPADTDRETLADLLVAPLYYRALVTGEPLSADTAHRIVDAALGPMGARP